jgi:hypothetical protein
LIRIWRLTKQILLGCGALLLGICFALGILELTLRFLPVFSGEVAADPDRDWPAHHMIPNSTYVYSAGWNLENVRRGRINNMGYVAPFDYFAGTSGIVVIGDSFIESVMNPYRETLQGALPSFLEEPALVMNFGISGATLAHDIGVAGLVGQRFTPRWAIAVVTHGNFIGGFKPSPGYYHWVLGPHTSVELTPETKKGFILKFFRGLSLTGYVRANLGADLGRLFRNRNREVPTPCAPADLTASDKQLIAYFADELPARLKLPSSHIILVFDTDRDAIYLGKSALAMGRCVNRDDQARRLLTTVAIRRGINVIDIDPVFRAYFALTGKYLDYSPIDAHWNGAAHILAAREVARVINADAHAGTD